jgi:hypothetical protein
LLHIWDQAKQNHVDLENRLDKIILYGLIDRKFGSSRQHNISSCRLIPARIVVAISLHVHHHRFKTSIPGSGTGKCPAPQPRFAELKDARDEIRAVAP